ncbi:MAG: DUF6753 family protein [Cyanobacteria bacterium J06629_19]
MNAKDKATRAKAKAAIDRALEHRNDGFRAKVLDMTLKNQWDVDDPAFLILLSTGEMRVLMEEHPAKFEQLMNRVFKQAESQFLSMHEKVMAALSSSELAAQALARRVEEVEQLLSSERSALMSEQQAMVVKLEGATKRQIDVLEAKASQLTAEGFAVSRTQAKDQVAAIAKQMRQVHYWETVFWACGVAGALVSMSWFSGWQMRGLADHNSFWGDVQRWNRDHVRECIKAEQNTCNIHIEVPDHPVEQ